MSYIKNLVALIRGNIKTLLLKFLNGHRFSYHPFLRINGGVDIRIDNKSRISLGRGILIDPRTVVSATDGGYLKIGSMVGINCNSMIMCHDSIAIGDNTIMGPGVYIYDHDHDFNSKDGVRRNDYKSSPVIIGKNCWIGAGSIILRGTTMGDNCLVAAGCVIKGNYPDGSVIIQKREEVIKQK